MKDKATGKLCTCTTKWHVPFKKITSPITGTDAAGDPTVMGTRVEYRLFGILLYEKILITPERFEVRDYDYQIFI